MKTLAFLGMGYTSASCLFIMAGTHFSGLPLPSSEMVAVRGGNPQAMRCSATCNHLSGYDLPCAGKSDGDSCSTCNADPDLYYYAQQKQSPTPPDCTVRTKGYTDDPQNSQQGCGFLSNGTCKTQTTGGLKCVNPIPTQYACKTAVIVIDQ